MHCMCTCFNSSFSGKDMRKYSLVEDGCTFRYLNNVVVEISQEVYLYGIPWMPLFFCVIYQKNVKHAYIQTDDSDGSGIYGMGGEGSNVSSLIIILHVSVPSGHVFLSPNQKKNTHTKDHFIILLMPAANSYS